MLALFLPHTMSPKNWVYIHNKVDLPKIDKGPNEIVKLEVLNLLKNVKILSLICYELGWLAWYGVKDSWKFEPMN